jgi:hypothetical protein
MLRMLVGRGSRCRAQRLFRLGHGNLICVTRHPPDDRHSPR